MVFLGVFLFFFWQIPTNCSLYCKTSNEQPKLCLYRRKLATVDFIIQNMFAKEIDFFVAVFCLAYKFISWFD